jgi:hypothetical protein
VQVSLNDALKNRGNVFERGRADNFHFDYVDGTVIGALSFEFEGFAFVGITMPLIFELWNLSDTLSRSAGMVRLLKIARKESEENEAVAILFITQLSFLVAHEFAHHDRGHHATRAQANGLRNDMEPGDQSGSLQDQAQEQDADGWAVFLQLTHLILRGGRVVAVQALQLESEPEDNVEKLLLSLFVISVCALLLLWPPSRFNEITIYKLSHPPQAARMNAIMRDVVTWCENNRPALVPWMTVQRFQTMIHAVEVAMSQNGVINWAEQTNFLHSPAGARYIALLDERARQIRTR